MSYVGHLAIFVLVMLLTHIDSKSVDESGDSNLSKLKQTVADLSSRIQVLNDTLHKDKPENAMFYAVIRSKSYSFNVDATVVFETVIVNDGGHFNKFDGVFVAPVTGTYLFSWTVSGIGPNWIATELVIEEKVISTAGQYSGGGGYPSGSMTALCRMEARDHAWIRTTGVSTDHKLYSQNDYPQSAFLGFLVHAE